MGIYYNPPQPQVATPRVALANPSTAPPPFLRGAAQRTPVMAWWGIPPPKPQVFVGNAAVLPVVGPPIPFVSKQREIVSSWWNIPPPLPKQLFQSAVSLPVNAPPLPFTSRQRAIVGTWWDLPPPLPQELYGNAAVLPVVGQLIPFTSKQREIVSTWWNLPQPQPQTLVGDMAIFTTAPIVPVVVLPNSGGYFDHSTVGERRRRKLPETVDAIIGIVAARQVEELQGDAQKQKRELQQTLRLRGIQYETRYLEELAERRETLIHAEIAKYQQLIADHNQNATSAIQLIAQIDDDFILAELKQLLARLTIH